MYFPSKMPKTFIIQKKISPKIHMKSKKKKNKKTLKAILSNAGSIMKLYYWAIITKIKISVSGIEDSQTHIATAV